MVGVRRRGLSISVKLPLLIGGLVVAVTGIYSWAAYQRMRTSSRAAATARLRTVAEQYARALKTQRDQFVAAARTVAASPALRVYVARPSAAARASAEAALRPGGLQAEQVVGVELWSADRVRLLTVGDPDRWTSSAAAGAFVQELAGTDSGAVGRFGAVGAPARLFLRQLTLIGAVVLVIGLIAAWATSRTITRPLAWLTHAAEAMAAGDDSQPVAVPMRDDELGRLAGAFDVMVAHVRESRQGLEQRVRLRTAELEERNAELEAFAYSISHDLRAPLRAMQGFSLALLEDYGDRLDEAGRRYAQRVITAARTMDRLIDDLLAYSRLARAELRLVPLDLGRLVRSSLEQLDGEMQGRAPRVTVAEPLPAVVGHGATLVQVFVNLVANAIKFVPADRVPEVVVRAEPLGGRVRVWVEDNGIGIAAEHHERIFRVFERLHRAEDYPGTGIGLAIVRKGVERMGGRVGVESALGSGSRFWIELPGAT